MNIKEAQKFNAVNGNSRIFWYANAANLEAGGGCYRGPVVLTFKGKAPEQGGGISKVDLAIFADVEYYDLSGPTGPCIFRLAERASRVWMWKAETETFEAYYFEDVEHFEKIPVSRELEWAPESVRAIFPTEWEIVKRNYGIVED
jgi:hypothetical protein